MNDNLAVAQRDGGLSADEVGQLMRNAFAMSWTTDTRKQAYLAALDNYLTASTGIETGIGGRADGPPIHIRGQRRGERGRGPSGP